MAVYYESLCPDSIRFITTQLYPTYRELGLYIDVEFVPYGNANVGTIIFSCAFAFILDHCYCCT